MGYVEQVYRGIVGQACGASKVDSVKNGTHQHWPARWKENKKENDAYQCSLLQRMLQQISALQTYSLKLVNGAPSIVTQALFKLMLLYWDLE